MPILRLISCAILESLHPQYSGSLKNIPWIYLFNQVGVIFLFTWFCFIPKEHIQYASLGTCLSLFPLVRLLGYGMLLIYYVDHTLLKVEKLKHILKCLAETYFNLSGFEIKCVCGSLTEHLLWGFNFYFIYKGANILGMLLYLKSYTVLFYLDYSWRFFLNNIF